MQKYAHLQMVVTFRSAHESALGQACFALPIQFSFDLLQQVKHLQCHVLEELLLLERSRISP
jgi:hypothetical protein